MPACRAFSHDVIKDSLYEYDILPKISRETFRFFRGLIVRVQKLVHDVDTWGGGWDGSLARSMFDHHAEQLYEIRQYASSRKQLLLKTYIYLCDASQEGFYSISLSEKQGVAYSKATFALSSPTKPLKATDNRCGHCNSVDLHIMFGKANSFDQ